MQYLNNLIKWYEWLNDLWKPIVLMALSWVVWWIAYEIIRLLFRKIFWLDKRNFSLFIFIKEKIRNLMVWIYGLLYVVWNYSYPKLFNKYMYSLVVSLPSDPTIHHNSEYKITVKNIDWLVVYNDSADIFDLCSEKVKNKFWKWIKLKDNWIWYTAIISLPYEWRYSFYSNKLIEQ